MMALTSPTTHQDVVQDEREPLGGTQRVQHHHQRGTDRIGQQRLVLGQAWLAGLRLA